MAGNPGTAVLGRGIAAKRLTSEGVRNVREATDFNRRVLRGRTPSGRELTFIVKSRTSGTWQGTINDGYARPPRRSGVLWIFVDLEPIPPEFYLVPDDWMRRDIHEAHQEYLRRHGGERAQSPDSTHHAIQTHRVAAWKDRWELLAP